MATDSVKLTEKALDQASRANADLKNVLDWADQIRAFSVVNQRENERLRALIKQYYPLIAGHAIALKEADDPQAPVWLEMCGVLAAAMSRYKRGI